MAAVAEDKRELAYAAAYGLMTPSQFSKLGKSARDVNVENQRLNELQRAYSVSGIGSQTVGVRSESAYTSIPGCSLQAQACMSAQQAALSSWIVQRLQSTTANFTLRGEDDGTGHRSLCVPHVVANVTAPKQMLSQEEKAMFAPQLRRGGRAPAFDAWQKLNLSTAAKIVYALVRCVYRSQSIRKRATQFSSGIAMAVTTPDHFNMLHIDYNVHETGAPGAQISGMLFETNGLGFQNRLRVLQDSTDTAYDIMARAWRDAAAFINSFDGVPMITCVETEVSRVYRMRVRPTLAKTVANDGLHTSIGVRVLTANGGYTVAGPGICAAISYFMFDEWLKWRRITFGRADAATGQTMIEQSDCGEARRNARGGRASPQSQDSFKVFERQISETLDAYVKDDNKHADMQNRVYAFMFRTGLRINEHFKSGQGRSQIITRNGLKSILHRSALTARPQPEPRCNIATGFAGEYAIGSSRARFTIPNAVHA